MPESLTVSLEPREDIAPARAVDPAAPDAGVSITGLARVFDDGTGLHPTDLTIATGEFISILGPSGCGKSTLLRCIAGLETPQQGRIRFGENTVFDDGVNLSPRHRRIGMVFQDLALWPHLSAFENVAFPLRVTRRRDAADADNIRARVDAALDLVGLRSSADKLPHQLSGGQQQRIAVARAVVARPDVLLMDEPLSALDAALKMQLRGELRALTKELGLTTIYVTHDQEEAMSLSDRIVVLSEGRVRQVSAPEDLYRYPADEFVAGFVGVFNVLPSAVSQADAGRIRGVRPGGVRIVDAQTAAAASALRISATVTESEYRGGSHLVRAAVAGVDRHWSVPSERPRAIGSVLALQVAASDVIDVAAYAPARH